MQETGNVALADFFLLAGSAHQCIPLGRYGRLGLCRQFEFGRDRRGGKGGKVFFAGKEHINHAGTTGAGRPAIAVDVTFGIQRQIEVDDVAHAYNVQSTRAQFSSHQDAGGAVPEFRQGHFPVLLFQSAVVNGVHQSGRSKQLPYPLHLLPRH